MRSGIENKTNLSLETKEEWGEMKECFDVFFLKSLRNVNNFEFIDFALIPEKRNVRNLMHSISEEVSNGAVSVHDLLCINVVEEKFKRNKLSFLSC
jgi:hypothetical protein